MYVRFPPLRGGQPAPPPPSRAPPVECASATVSWCQPPPSTSPLLCPPRWVCFRNSELVSGRLGKATLGGGNKSGLFQVRAVLRLWGRPVLRTQRRTGVVCAQRGTCLSLSCLLACSTRSTPPPFLLRAPSPLLRAPILLRAPLPVPPRCSTPITPPPTSSYAPSRHSYVPPPSSYVPPRCSTLTTPPAPPPSA